MSTRADRPAPDDQPTLLVSDIQRFCVHDGPGLRTVVFLKGCPLRCAWCQNPESLSSRPEIAYYADRCRGCLLCREACPRKAIVPEPHRVDRGLCDGCGECARACPHEALRRVGEELSPERLLELVEADRSFFDSSGGGVTLSGGEPLLQADGVAALLCLCAERGLHTTVETCGAVPWPTLERMAPLVDLFYFDLKAHGDALHRRLTGSPAGPIVDTARRLVGSGATVSFRMPVVPGHTDDAASLRGLSGLLRELGHSRLRLLPYHRAGETKIDRVASAQPRLGLSPERAAGAIEHARTVLEAEGIEPVVEGDTAVPHAGHRASAFPERVWRLREAVQHCQPEVCSERAELITEFFRARRRPEAPMIVRKAEALRYVLRHRRAAIHDHELLVGSFSSKRVGGSVFPELHGVAMLEDLLSFGSREVNPLAVGARERRALGLRVLPFWLTRFLGLRAFPLPRALRFIAGQLGGKRYLINESGGISHLVPDYGRLLREGTEGISADARRRGELCSDPGRRDFYRAVEIACTGLEELAAPYAHLARSRAATEADPERRAELLRVAEACERVPRSPARTLHEAFQSLLFAQIAINLESLDNSVCPGRLDQVLHPFLLADLRAGRLDDDAVHDLVGCFTVKMCEIVPVFSRRLTRFHGGMFNGQVVVVGGIDREGNDATNALSFAFLDAMDELRMRQPNFHARIHTGSPAPYLERVAEMLRDGSGAPSLMNDEVVVPMLIERGTEVEDARDYSPVGCIEPVACNASFASTDAALLNLALPMEWALGTRRGGAHAARFAGCTSLEALLEVLAVQIDHLVDRLIADLQAIERANARLHPTPLTSMLLRGCLESGTDSTAGGALYNASGVQGIGVADLADSLAAVDEVVLRRGLATMGGLVAALRADFEGHEALRGHLLKAPKFGNDNAVVDRLADRVMALFAGSLARHTSTRGGAYNAGFYAVTAHVAFGETTGALPSGRRAGRPLAGGLSPANGADRLGPTAALASAARLDLRRTARNGVNVNLRLDRTSLAGGEGPRTLAALIRGYFRQGGMQLQANVLDPDVLLEARDDPERHPWLLVRVSGYSAYFNDLSPEAKQDIIDRTRH